MRERRWYSRFGIQPPLPWVGAAGAVAGGGAAGLVLVAGVAWLGLYFGLVNDDLTPSW